MKDVCPWELNQVSSGFLEKQQLLGLCAFAMTHKQKGKRSFSAVKKCGEKEKEKGFQCPENTAKIYIFV